MQRLTPHLTFAQDDYYRLDRHYLDEGQFGFVPIDAPFNYVRGWGAGNENSLTWNLDNFSARANLFVAREEDIGVASGQYNFPLDELSSIGRHYIVLDHSSLVGAVWWARISLARLSVHLRWVVQQRTTWRLRESDGASQGLAVQYERRQRLRYSETGQIHKSDRFLNILDRTNLIRPANGIGVFQAAYGPRITVYDALTLPLPEL